MNTTEAATRANVTTATIRTWARIGAVAAVKTSGKWDIDEASLTHRIALTAKPAAPKPLTVENLIAIGGSRWTKNGNDRVYLNDWAGFAGIETAHYNTGRVASATLDGRPIANGRIAGILGTVSKVYFDAADGQLYVNHSGARDIEVRFLDGTREHIDLVAMIGAGVRAAVNAL